MACAGCARRGRKLRVAAAVVMHTLTGRPAPRKALDAMVGVKCTACRFTAEGVCFAWDEKAGCGYCPKCGSRDLLLGSARP